MVDQRALTRAADQNRTRDQTRIARTRIARTNDPCRLTFVASNRPGWLLQLRRGRVRSFLVAQDRCAVAALGRNHSVDSVGRVDSTGPAGSTRAAEPLVPD